LVTARKLLNDVLANFSEKAPKAMVCLESGFDDATVVMALPEPYRWRLRSTKHSGALKSRGVPAGKGDPYLPQHRFGYEAARGPADGAR